jgi:two-component sensor histidine kinase/PAS domain-containing protein
MSESKRETPQPQLFDDAEETVEAIHRGSVDALVVMKGSEGPRVIMLQGAEEPYRLLVERMSEGALTFGPDGVILYVNGRVCELTGYPAESLVHRDIATLFEGEAPTLAPNVPLEASLLRNDNTSLPVSVWAGPISIGDTSATLVTLTDLSVRRRAEQIAAAERFARSVLEQATSAVLVLAPNGRITHASAMAEELAQEPPIGRTFSEAFPLEAEGAPQAGTLASFSAESLDTMLATKPFHGVEVRLQNEHAAKRTFLLSAGPLLDDAKAPVGSIVTLTDMTERKRAEEQQTMLVAELNHRVKNILAIVQSVARQTIRSSDSLTDFMDVFSGRLKALAIAHDILTQTRWIGIGLKELLTAVLAPHLSAEEERVTMEGPAILLSAPAVMPLSMALHELTTNAAKYGALSVRGGRIDISWTLTGGEDQSVELSWKERGGPKVARGTSTGFGTVLIDRVITYDLDGTTKIDFDPSGVRCTLTFPLRDQARSPVNTPRSAID